MDYFKQRRAYRKLKRDQIDISTGQNNLYRELLDYANDEYQLDNQFTLKNSALLDLTGLSESGLKKVRNELVQLGLIDYVPGKKNKQKPKYQIKRLYVTSWGTKTKSSSSTGAPTSSSTGAPTSSSTGSSKELTSNLTDNSTSSPNNNNQDEPNPFVPLINMYQQEFGIMSPIAKQQLFDSVNDFTAGGATDQQASEIIQYAIEIAVSYNKRSWNYTAKILDDWLNHSLFDLNNIKAYQTKSRKPKQKYGRYNQRPKETGTDWSQVKAKKMPNNSNNLQDRLAKIRGKQDATN